jgi:transcriptional regulator of NAD metabolism
MIPDIVNISEAKVSDRHGVDDFRYVKDKIIVYDRGILISSSHSVIFALR